MCNFVCGTMLHAKMMLHWSVIHYQVTFEVLSDIMGVFLNCLLILT